MAAKMTTLWQRIIKDQRGIALVEFSIAATVVLTVIFGVLEMSRLFWTANTLVEATRIGARFAVINAPNADAVKNIVVFGTPAGGTTPVVSGLSVNDVTVTYSEDFGLGNGRANVSINNFQFAFIVPLIGTTITLPPFMTTLTGEIADAPIPQPGASPSPTTNPTPTPTPTPSPSPTPTPSPSPTPSPCGTKPNGTCNRC